jgi:hypothetical protein
MAENDEEHPWQDEPGEEPTPEEIAAELRAKRMTELRPLRGSFNAREKNEWDRLWHAQRVYEAEQGKRWRDQAQGDDD